MVKIDVEDVKRNLAKAVRLIDDGDLKRAAVYLEVALAAVESHLQQRDVVVSFVDDPCQGVPR